MSGIAGTIYEMLKESRYTVVLSGRAMLEESGYPVVRDGESPMPLRKSMGTPPRRSFPAPFFLPGSSSFMIFIGMNSSRRWTYRRERGIMKWPGWRSQASFRPS